MTENNNIDITGASCHNLPAVLENLVRRWTKEKRTFYLGPENIFFLNSVRIEYQNGETIPIDCGSWKAHTPDGLPSQRLSREDIDEIQYELFKDSIPERAIVSVDYKCNVQCSMCTYHGRDKDLYAEKYSKQCQSLPLELIKSRLDKLAALGVKAVHIGSEGEIFLRRDWEDIFSYTASLFYIIASANATTFDSEKLEILLKYKEKIAAINISLNALTFETWSKINGVKNKALFDQAVKATEFLTDNRIPISVSLVATKDNAHEIEGFAHYWAERRISVNIANELLTQNLMFGDPRINNSGWPYYLCKSINNALMIGVDGTIVPCCRTTYCLDDDNHYNIPKINIDDSLKSIKTQWREILKNKAYKNVCRSCTLFDLRQGNACDEPTLYGYKGAMTFHGFNILPRKREKRKKSVPARIVAEMNRFGRRVKNKLSK